MLPRKGKPREGLLFFKVSGTSACLCVEGNSQVCVRVTVERANEGQEAEILSTGGEINLRTRDTSSTDMEWKEVYFVG